VKAFFIKTKRTFSPVRQYAWLFTLLVAFGGLWVPKLGLLVFGVIFLLTFMSLFKGRYWCGTYCAHGSLFDQLLLPFSRNHKIPRLLKSNYTRAAVFGWFMYNLGSKFFRVSRLWGTLPFWDRLGFVFVGSYLMVTILGGVLGLAFTPRSWCQFCPMGTMQVLMYKLGKPLGLTKKRDHKVTINSLHKCHKCAKCARVCPMQLLPYTEFSGKNQFDNEICIRCLTCIENCPAKILTLSTADEAEQLSQRVDLAGYDARTKIQAKITGVHELTEDIREFTFEFINPHRVEYHSGQFFLVKFQDNPEMFRAYSVSGLGADREVRLTIKRVPQGYATSVIFDTFVTGTHVVLEGPMGQELFVKPGVEKALLVAGGIGITPFVPIAHELAKAGKTVKLVYGVNSVRELIFDDTLRALAAEATHFDYAKVIANPDEGYTGVKGSVTDVIKTMDLVGYTVYICGSKPMVAAVKKLLESRGITADKIHAESA